MADNGKNVMSHPADRLQIFVNDLEAMIVDYDENQHQGELIKKLCFYLDEQVKTAIEARKIKQAKTAEEILTEVELESIDRVMCEEDYRLRVILPAMEIYAKQFKN